MATEHAEPHKFNQDEFTHQPHSDEHPDHREHSDVRIAPLVWSLVALVLTTIFTLVLIFGMIKGFEFWQARQPESQRRTVLNERPEVLPAGVPPLQGIPGPADQPRFHANTPAKDMAAFRAQNNNVLKFGDKGVLPVEQAMQLAVEKNIFAKEPTPPMAGSDSSRPGRNGGTGRDKANGGRSAGGAAE